MFDTNFTNEAVNIFKYIKDELIIKYPTSKITIEYFMLSVLENEESVACQLLSKTTMASTMHTMHEWFANTLANGKSIPQNGKMVYDPLYDRCIEMINKTFKVDNITSGHILLSILRLNDSYAKHFKQIGITYEQLYTGLNAMLPQYSKALLAINSMGIVQNGVQKGAVEELLINMNELAANGKIDEVIGNNDIISDIFNIFSKRDRNNVILTGDSGIGKTVTVSHIANLLVNGNVPESFKNKKLMKVDFMTLVSGSALRGNFEAKINAIIADAVKKDGYIFFIDDLQSIMSNSNRFAEINLEGLLNMFLAERNIKMICTMDNKSYSSYILGNPLLKRRFHKIEMKEKSDEEVLRIIRLCKTKYEKFHGVTYTDKAIEDCVKIVRQYVKDGKLPDYAIDILDEAGARKSLAKSENSRLSSCKKKLKAVKVEITNSSERMDYDKYDELKEKELELNSELKLIEKENKLNESPLVVDDDDIREIISEKINVPVTKLTLNERDRLKTLEENIKKKVIGQDKAVNEVCRAVKRQRIGLSSSNRPVVLFFSGMTGTGKTFLSKKLAEEVFGNEKSIVRLDMSEYSDKMTVSKLIGASPGYIGYDKGGILTEAIKKNNHCILLLDEMEKANDEVHNVFLQLFDDGRLTDNMGNIVDFSNVIVIMTSNVGAREISAKGGGIGFVRDENKDNMESIKKAMKNKFSPEFINRIDSIVYFNKLTEENIKEIIKIEIGNLGKKLENISYKLGDSFTSDETVSYVYNKVKDESNYGARPITHVIQHEIEDKITDYIIENQPEEGFTFEKDTIGLCIPV